ncbi:mitochondrial intermembrane space import and assembly protein 40-B-like, partial [Aphidius gifuensis]|uniref:mitochondrial intermembrane space import and assembly protein 40-B-like n=1 Tax=Aphidius gifuensis TaxID=684658 RepID=UPI001CDC1C9B
INNKDEVRFVTKKDHESPSKIILPEPEPRPGLILPNGEINWSCPCLGGLPTGPCGLEYRESASCFFNSTPETKDSECSEKLALMLSCMSKYPTLYGKVHDDDDEQKEHQHEDKKINEHKNDKTTDNDETTGNDEPIQPI